MAKLQRLCAWLYYKVLGFTSEETVERPAKYVIALAPHTSNWDFMVGMLYCHACGVRCNFVMKSEWFFWPLGSVFRMMGGIPVRRDRKSGLTDQLATAAVESDTFRLCITPEGTRKAQPHWKRGFYYIAMKAKIPILLYGLDYDRRLISCTKMMMPTGDVERDMREIMLYFTPFRGKHPDRFTTEDI